MRVGTLLERLLDSFPTRDAEAWDHVGLSVGDPQSDFDGVLVALDASVRNVERTSELGCNVLVTHHPVYIKAPGSFVPPSPASPTAASAVYRAIQRGVSIISMHTNLDRSLEARALMGSLVDMSVESSVEFPFDPLAHGIGALGECRHEDLADLVARCASAFRTQPRVWGHACRPIHRVAVVGGSLGDFGERAIESGAEVVVCGEAGYHVAQDLHERGCSVVLLGHDRSEEPFVDILADSVAAAGVGRARISTIRNPDQWWTYTKGERS